MMNFIVTSDDNIRSYNELSLTYSLIVLVPCFLDWKDRDWRSYVMQTEKEKEKGTSKCHDTGQCGPTLPTGT
jgi:hypothetical protein